MDRNHVAPAPRLRQRGEFPPPGLDGRCWRPIAVARERHLHGAMKRRRSSASGAGALAAPPASPAPASSSESAAALPKRTRTTAAASASGDHAAGAAEQLEPASGGGGGDTSARLSAKLLSIRFIEFPVVLCYRPVPVPRLYRYSTTFHRSPTTLSPTKFSLRTGTVQ